MKACFKRAALTYGCVVLGAVLGTTPGASAQQGRPGGPPPVPRGGAPGGLGGPGGPPPPPPPPPNGTANPRQQQNGSGNAARGGLQFGPPGRWWDDHHVISTVGLRPAQQRKMDAIFDANKSAIVSDYKTLMEQQAKLAALNKQANVDSATLFATIDSVNQARASLQKATSEMLLQIRGEMEPGQITKLESIR